VERTSAEENTCKRCTHFYNNTVPVYTPPQCGKRSGHVSATGRGKKYKPLLLQDVYNIIIKPLLLVLHNIIIGVEITPYYFYIIYYMNIFRTMNRIHRGTPPPISSRSRVFRATARASGPKRNLVCPCGGAYVHVCICKYVCMYVRVSCVCMCLCLCVCECACFTRTTGVVRRMCATKTGKPFSAKTPFAYIVVWYI